MSDQLIARPLPTQGNTLTSMPRVGFESTILASKRAKTVHALDHSVTVTGIRIHTERKMETQFYAFLISTAA
jgi:hypothetical protein